LRSQIGAGLHGAVDLAGSPGCLAELYAVDAVGGRAVGFALSEAELDFCIGMYALKNRGHQTGVRVHFSKIVVQLLQLRQNQRIRNVFVTAYRISVVDDVENHRNGHHRPKTHLLVLVIVIMVIVLFDGLHLLLQCRILNKLFCQHVHGAAIALCPHCCKGQQQKTGKKGSHL
jgi:hypothetical protein